MLGQTKVYSSNWKSQQVSHKSRTSTMKLLSWSSTLITCLRFNYPVCLDRWLLLILQNGGLEFNGLPVIFDWECIHLTGSARCTSQHPQTDRTKSAAATLPCEMTSGRRSSGFCRPAQQLRAGTTRGNTVWKHSATPVYQSSCLELRTQHTSLPLKTSSCLQCSCVMMGTSLPRECRPIKEASWRFWGCIDSPQLCSVAGGGGKLLFSIQNKVTHIRQCWIERKQKIFWI